MARPENFTLYVDSDIPAASSDIVLTCKLCDWDVNLGTEIEVTELIDKGMNHVCSEG